MATWLNKFKWGSKIISSGYARELDFILLMFVLSLIALKSKVLRFLVAHCMFIERKIEREAGYKSIRADMLGSGGETVLKENWGQWEDRVYL